MFSFRYFSLFLAVLFWCFFFSVPPNPTVSSLFMHTDIASNSTGNNNGTKHTFLRANKMDGDWLNRRLCLRKVPHILSKYGGRGRGRERENFMCLLCNELCLFPFLYRICGTLSTSAHGYICSRVFKEVTELGWGVLGWLNPIWLVCL